MKTDCTKFRQLHIGQVFEFESIKSFPLSGMERGPWVKISARKYRKNTTPFSADYSARMDHALYSRSDMECQVGSINALVIPQP